MLYDPKWNKQDSHSIDNLISWLETKDPNEKYSYIDSSVCLLAQWAKHFDSEADRDYISGPFFYFVKGKSENYINFASIANNLSFTFGEALVRARTEGGY